MKAYSYIRWSSDPQTKGDSLTRQLEATRAICKQKGWQLDESLCPDKGVSGYNGANLEKGSLGAFLSKVKNREILTPCVLVVEALDRLTRTRLRDARKLFDGLLESKVSICTAHNAKVYDESSLENPLDLIISLMELNAAHQYSAAIGRRVSAAWTRKKEAAARGELLTLRTPAWIIQKKGTRKKSFTVDKAKAKVIQRIFKEYLEHKGVFTIARDLNKDGIEPFGWGKSWGSTVIRRYLSSPSVIGEYQPQKYVSPAKCVPDGQPVEDYYPPIITKAQFYKVQEMMKARFTPRGARRNVLTLFTGLVKCGKCGSPMNLKAGNITTKNNREPWLALVCSKALRGKGCRYFTMRYQPFENAILSALIVDALDGAHPRTEHAQLDEHRAELQHVQQKIQRANNVIIGQDNVPKSLVDTLNNLEKREAELKATILAAPTPEDDDAPTLYSQILQGGKEPIEQTIENRLKMRGVLSQIIERIELDAEKRQATLFHPWRYKNPKTGKITQVCKTLAWDKDDLEGFNLNGHWQHYRQNMLWKRRKRQVSA